MDKSGKSKIKKHPLYAL